MTTDPGNALPAMAVIHSSQTIHDGKVVEVLRVAYTYAGRNIYFIELDGIVTACDSTYLTFLPKGPLIPLEEML